MTETPVDSFIGSLIQDRYAVEELIGRGGMANVYLAKDQSLGRPVALKIFRAESTEVDEMRRQRGEIELLAGLNHPSLVTLFDAGVDYDEHGLGRGFLVMELVEGENLSHHLEKGPLPAAHVDTIGAELAEALHHIHRAGVIHRDVKPANILLMPSDIPGAAGRVKLTDFGIALLVDVPRMTAAGSVLGTASYLSPEQALGQPLTPATDVYSLGLVLLECLTGTRAFPGTVLESAQARILRPPAIPDTLPPGWAQLLAAMTTREPESRLSALDVAERCRQILHKSAAQGDEPTALLETMLEQSTQAMTTPTQAVSNEPAPLSAFDQAWQGDSLIPDGNNDVTSVLPSIGTESFLSGQPSAGANSYPGRQQHSGATAPLLPRVEAPDSSALTRPRGQERQFAEREPSGRPRRSLWLLLSAVILAIIIAAGAIAISVANSPQEATSPSYPSVPGELGTHLRDLQESVEP